MSKPILYSFRRCPFAIRARMAIYAAGQSVQIREVLLRDKPPSMLAISPKGTVPVLWLPDGTVIEESLEIMYWALEKNDPRCLLDVNTSQAGIGQVILSEISSFNQLIRQYKFINRYPDLDFEQIEDALVAMMTEYNSLLCQWRYLTGNQMTLYDYALFPFVRQVVSHNKALFNEKYHLEQLLSWHDSIIQSQDFQAVMGKYAPWQEGQSGVDVP